MELIKATLVEFDIVKNIVHQTIKEIYPNYYPKGTVDFFLNHHSDENIKSAIERKEVYLLLNGNTFVGTGSVRENELCRLFVLPQYQGQGYGTEIMDLLEGFLLQIFDKLKLDASLPAYNIYIKRGYIPIEFHKILTKNGNYLCYHLMELIKNRN